jgi:hypothetical protein
VPKAALIANSSKPAATCAFLMHSTAGLIFRLLSFRRKTIRENVMANVFIEARPKGRSEGSAIDDYVVEDHAGHALKTFKTQKEAIDWARSQGHAPLVARVRHLNDKKKPDHWRAA